MFNSFQDVSLQGFLEWYKNPEHVAQDCLICSKDSPDVWDVIRNRFGTKFDYSEEYFKKYLVGFKIPYDPQDGCC